MTDRLRQSPLAVALAGGIAGSLLTLLLLVALAPGLAGQRLVGAALRAHPELLIEASDRLRERQYEPLLAANRAAIETPFHSSWKGAAKPDVTLVYFFDYACGYCRKSNPDLERLVAEDKGLRIVYRELPILGPQSVAAARLSLAASKAGRFAAYHDALNAQGQPSEAAVVAAARRAAVALPDAPDPAIEAELRDNLAMAERLGATGTPLFIVGNRVINSAVGYDALKAAVAAARAG